MRTRKPAATSRGNTCHRCTALLLGEAQLCSMCGWPAGVGYPPADGELEAVGSSEPEPEPQVDADAEHAAAQLDALTGLAQRQAQPTAGPAADATAEPAQESPPESSEPAEPAEEAVSESTPADAPPAEAVESSSDPAAVTTDTEVVDDGDVDPLTAPLTELPDSPAESAADLDEATPIAVAAEAVVHGSPPADDSEPNDAPETVDRSDDPVDHTNDSSVPAAGRRASSLARPVQLLVVAAAVLGVLLAVLQAAFGSPIDESMTTVALGLSLLQIAVWTAAAITFLYWVSRAYQHVALTSAHTQRHGPSMALIGWVIPVVGLFIGYRVLQDLWVGSDPVTRQSPDASPQNARLIDVWLLGLVTAMLFAYAAPMALGDSSLWSGLAALGVLASGLSLAVVVSKISGWQDQPDVAATGDTEVAAEGTVTTRVDQLQAQPVDAPEPVSAPAE